MKLCRRILCIVAAVFVIAVFAATPLTAFADNKITVQEDNMKASVTLSSDFSTLTKSDLDNPVEYFKNFPLTKNEFKERLDSGVLFDSFSKDKTREIRFSKYSSNEIGKYSVKTASTANDKNGTQTNNLISGVHNFSSMSEIDRKQFISTFSQQLAEQGHTLLSTPCEITLSDYKFIKICARIGSSSSGYTYTSVMTIIGGVCYELTCYDNSPMLEQTQIDENQAVIDSLKLSIKGNSGEIASNTLMSAVAFVIIIVAVIVIVVIIISFIKPLISRKNEDEHIGRRK